MKNLNRNMTINLRNLVITLCNLPGSGMFIPI